MRQGVVVLLLLAAVPAVAAKRKPAPKPPEPPAVVAASVAREADGTRVDLTWDGPLLGWAIPKDASGRRSLYALVGLPEGDAKTCTVEEAGAGERKDDARLYRWREESPEHLELVRAGLPRGRLDTIAIDGVERPVLVRAGGIDAVADDGTLRPLVADPEIDAALGDPRSADRDVDARDAALRVVLPGELRTYGRGDTGAWRVASSATLPVRVAPESRRIRIETPAVRPVGRLGGRGMAFATEAEPVGSTRVRTTLLTPDASPATEPIECWAQLPRPERVLDNTYAVMDGRAVWIALTMSAEKLSLFTEKALRIYDLGADRTRVGASPRVAAATGLNIWQLAYPVVADVDGDGHDDLVLGYWKGLRRSIAALEIYPGSGSGSLGKRREMEITVEDADEGFLSFGRDADGDGRPDLVVLTKTAALVYPGTAKPRERLVAEEPSRRVSLRADRPGANAAQVEFSLGGVATFRWDPGFGTPRPADLDGDGQAELLFVGNVKTGGRASIVHFRKAGGASLARGEGIRYK